MKFVANLEIWFKGARTDIQQNLSLGLEGIRQHKNWTSGSKVSQIVFFLSLWEPHNPYSNLTNIFTHL